jgi:hypothetical protein
MTRDEMIADATKPYRKNERVPDNEVGDYAMLLRLQRYKQARETNNFFARRELQALVNVIASFAEDCPDDYADALALADRLDDELQAKRQNSTDKGYFRDADRVAKREGYIK